MHVSAWWWLAVPAVLAVLAVLAAGATVGGTRRRRARAYSRRSARHVLGDFPQAPAPAIGSMILAEERAIGYGYVPAPWREQTRADLAPETLDAPRRMPWPFGFPPDHPERFDIPGLFAAAEDEGWEVIDDGPGLCPCGKPIDHTEFCYDSGPGVVPSETSPGPAPSDLGPRAALVLDRWERGFRARWGCPWLELGALT